MSAKEENPVERRLRAVYARYCGAKVQVGETPAPFEQWLAEWLPVPGM